MRKKKSIFFQIDRPLTMYPHLGNHPRHVFGAHKVSNTEVAATRASDIAIGKLMGVPNAR